MWFEALSGLRINLNMSEILPIGLVDDVNGRGGGLSIAKIIVEIMTQI